MRKSLYDYCIEQSRQALLVQWDKESNTGLDPHTVSYGSKRKIWWRCEKGHRWQATVVSRTGASSGCPYCLNKRVLPNVNSLAVVLPEIAAQWHTEKNRGLTPNEVLPGSHQRVWWKCEMGHEWDAQIKARAQGSGCPICTNRQVVVGTNDLAVTHPEIAAQWHPSKNGIRKPQMVFSGSHQRVWWKCEKGHEWQATISSRTTYKTGCPVCTGKQVQPGENDLATVFPNIAAQWHPDKNGDLLPSNVTPFSNLRVWWRCRLGHEYISQISARCSDNSGCPFCSGKKVLPGFNDLATKYPTIAEEWHPTLNGTLTPQMVTAGSKKKIWWQCAEGHVWKTVIYSRTGQKKTGCPVCAGKVKTPR